MSLALNYQFSIFGKYSITPSPETITSLMGIINKSTNLVFLPNIVNSQQIEIPTNNVNIISNLSFVSQDQRISIVALTERIDVNYTRVSGSDINITDFSKIAQNVLSSIMAHENLSSYRLAVNCQFLLEDTKNDSIMNVGKKLIKGAKYYTDKNFFEWSTRVNAQSDITIFNQIEPINVITDISTAQAVLEKKKAIIYLIDINTLPQNTAMRFTQDSLSYFADSVLPIVKQLVDDVEGLVFCDE